MPRIGWLRRPNWEPSRSPGCGLVISTSPGRQSGWPAWRPARITATPSEVRFMELMRPSTSALRPCTSRSASSSADDLHVDGRRAGLLLLAGRRQERRPRPAISSRGPRPARAALGGLGRLACARPASSRSRDERGRCRPPRPGSTPGPGRPPRRSRRSRMASRTPSSSPPRDVGGHDLLAQALLGGGDLALGGLAGGDPAPRRRPRPRRARPGPEQLDLLGLRSRLERVELAGGLPARPGPPRPARAARPPGR